MITITMRILLDIFWLVDFVLLSNRVPKKWVLPNWAFADMPLISKIFLPNWQQNLQMLTSIKLSFFRNPVYFCVFLNCDSFHSNPPHKTSCLYFWITIPVFLSAESVFLSRHYSASVFLSVVSVLIVSLICCAPARGPFVLVCLAIPRHHHQQNHHHHHRR